MVKNDRVVSSGWAVRGALAGAMLLALAWAATAAEPVGPLTGSVAEKSPPPNRPSAVATLPLQRVVLFSSGVGFFEHRGAVQGNAQVPMNFRVGNINDLLKSMVVQDEGGGQVATVGYGSKDPIGKTLGSFAIDLTANPGLAQLLNQVRGEKVEIDASSKITGTILGVEIRTRQVDKDKVVPEEVLNLVTDEGLRSVKLDLVSRIKLLDENLNAELQKALVVLASSHAADKKTVTLNFLGEGKRNVRVGYIQETPIWKTSYRLVLDEKKAPWLQGWAIVENTTEEDWSGVDLMLVSGRPISFVIDLYQPLYLPRPTVQRELYASLVPQTYDQDLARRELEFAAADKPAALAAPASAPALARRSGGAKAPALAEAAGRAEMAAGGRMLGAAGQPADSRGYGAWGFDPQSGVRSAATAGNIGELFQYRIAMPVQLARRQSAMLPIVNAEVKGEKLSIYNPQVQPKHPLNGLRLTNATDLHLMQGPITVFDGGAYAGDAQIEDLPPKSERLLSYAIDLDTEVALDAKPKPEELLSVRLVRGTAITARKFVRTTEYAAKNSGSKAKKLLIERSVEPGWDLVAPKEPTEKTRGVYRFAVAAEPGKPAKLEVVEQRVDQQQVAITNLDQPTIQLYLRSQVVSEKVKVALAEVVKRKLEIAQTTEQRTRLEQEIAAITQEQARIRENMARLDQSSDLYKRYVKKFTEQEDQIEKSREKIAQLRDQETRLTAALEQYLVGLELD